MVERRCQSSDWKEYNEEMERRHAGRSERFGEEERRVRRFFQFICLKVSVDENVGIMTLVY